MYIFIYVHSLLTSISIFNVWWAILTNKGAKKNKYLQDFSKDFSAHPNANFAIRVWAQNLTVDIFDQFFVYTGWLFCWWGGVLGEWPNRWHSSDIRKHSSGFVGISVSLFATSSPLFLLHGAVFITK